MKSKTGRIIAMVLVILITAGFGYISFFGMDSKKSGSVNDINLGLDLAGGVSITYQIVGDGTPSTEDIDDTVYKLKMKAETYSTEAQVYKEGDDRITIEIPGVSDAESILQELGKPGSLYFIAETDADGNKNYEYEHNANGESVYVDENGVKFVYVGSDLAARYDSETGTTLKDENGNPVPYDLTATEEHELCYALNKSIDELKADGSIILEGADVANAKPGTQQDPQTGMNQTVVSLSFNSNGREAFANATQKAYSNGESIAIYFDGKFISVPRVSAVINDGNAVITGMANYEEADVLASKIRIGALKLELEELRSNIVGAQLGSEAISTSIKAGIIGFIVVVLFMIAVYFMPGFSSALALVMYTFMMIITLSIFDVTLTLPGIAGIILSVGMAVDANVIIFARIREELATGKTVQSSVDIGFKKALSAILDGNITTLIAAFVLIALGSGTVRGFAQTLAIGIILSMITALFISRVILNGFIALGLSSEKLFGVAKERKSIDFVKNGKIFAIISGALIVVGIIFMVIFGIKDGKALDYSLEFQGGSSTTVALAEDLSIEEIDAQITPSIEKIVGEAAQIQKVEGSTQIIVKTKSLTEEERNELTNMFVNEFSVDEKSITTETISATISSEMKRDSILAVVLAVICMLIYIWLRFSDFRFGVSSVLALCHDVLIVLAFYAVARVSVGSTFIACMLTIVGYSINATIVVFDRIRENKKAAMEVIKTEGPRSRKRKRNPEAAQQPRLDIKGIVNKSITQTLSRSLFTSFTTFVMVFFLFIMGVTAIKEFALPLMIGIVCGAYSSVCLAGFMWYFLRSKFAPKHEDEDEDEDYV